MTGCVSDEFETDYCDCPGLQTNNCKDRLRPSQPNRAMAATEEGKARTAAKRVGVLLACTLAVAYAVRSAKPIAATWRGPSNWGETIVRPAALLDRNDTGSSNQEYRDENPIDLRHSTRSNRHAPKNWQDRETNHNSAPYGATLPECGVGAGAPL